MNNYKMNYTVFKLCIIFLVCGFYNAHTATIEGRLLGADGTPMALSHVQFRPLVHYDTLSQLYECNKDGYFKIETQDTGFVLLRFSGVNHKPFQYPFYISDVDENIEIECQMVRNKLDTNDAIFILGNFNGNRFYDSAFVMKKIDAGVYSIEINYPKDTLIYQILNPLGNERRSVNGTSNAYYQRDNEGDYYSIYIDKNPIKKITLETKFFDPPSDPSPKKSKLPSVSVLKGQNAMEFAKVCEELKMELPPEDRLGYFLYDSTFKESNLMDLIVGNKLGAGFQKQLDTLDSLISRTHYYPSKMLLYMEFFNYATTAKIMIDGSKIGIFSLVSVDINKNRIQEGLKYISPISPLWIGFSIGPEDPIICSILADGIDSSQYFDEFADSYPVQDFRKNVLIKAFQYYDELDIDNSRKKNLLGKLITDFPNDREVYSIKQDNSPNKKIKVGKQVPKFTIKDMDTGKLITKKDLIGKYTLIDFWAVWCSPCVGELPNITKAYEKYKDTNFQVITISFDKKIEDVKAFREKRFAMPWINAWELKGFASEIAQDFEVSGIPRPILIGPDGSILAVDMKLRYNNLEKTLEMYLGK